MTSQERHTHVAWKIKDGVVVDRSGLSCSCRYGEDHVNGFPEGTVFMENPHFEIAEPTVMPSLPTYDEGELRKLYRRCDVSNNGTEDAVGEDEFVQLITSREKSIREQAEREARLDEAVKARDVAFKHGMDTDNDVALVLSRRAQDLAGLHPSNNKSKGEE